MEHYRFASLLDIKNTSDKILFYREYGMLLLFTKDKNSKNEAKRYFEMSTSKGYDPIAINKLSEILSEEGKYNSIIDIITKNKDNMSKKDKSFIYHHLLKAYKYKNEFIKYREIQLELEKINSGLREYDEQ